MVVRHWVEAMYRQHHESRFVSRDGVHTAVPMHGQRGRPAVARTGKAGRPAKPGAGRAAKLNREAVRRQNNRNEQRRSRAKKAAAAAAGGEGSGLVGQPPPQPPARALAELGPLRRSCRKRLRTPKWDEE